MTGRGWLVALRDAMDAVALGAVLSALTALTLWLLFAAIFDGDFVALAVVGGVK